MLSQLPDTSCHRFLLNAIPAIVSVVTLTVYVLLGNKLTAAKTFTSLSLFLASPCYLSALTPCHSMLLNATNTSISMVTLTVCVLLANKQTAAKAFLPLCM